MYLLSSSELVSLNNSNCGALKLLASIDVFVNSCKTGVIEVIVD